MGIQLAREKTGNPYIQPIETEWGSISNLGLTLSCNWTTNTSFSVKAKRKEDELHLLLKVEASGAPSPNANLVFTLGGAEIEQNKLNTTFGSRCYLPSESGFIFDFDQGDFFSPWAYASTSTVIGVSVHNETIVTNSAITPSVPFTWASGDKLEILIKVPIKNWDTHEIIGARDSSSKNKGIQYKPVYIVNQNATGMANATDTNVGSDTLTIPAGKYLLEMGGNARVLMSSGSLTSSSWILRASDTSNNDIVSFGTSVMGLYAANDYRANGNWSWEVTLSVETTVKIRSRIGATGGTVSSRDSTECYMKWTRQ